MFGRFKKAPPEPPRPQAPVVGEVWRIDTVQYCLSGGDIKWSKSIPSFISVYKRVPTVETVGVFEPKSRAFRLLAEAKARHPEWVVKRIGT